MICLLLSVLCSTLIFIVFKLFDRYGIDNLQAIVVNYMVAFGVGCLVTQQPVSPGAFVDKVWFASAILLGFLFISLFQLMARVAQKYGVAAVSVAVKMSLIIPVIFAVIHYGESLGILKVLGILMALAAVYFATKKPRVAKPALGIALLPLLLFLGSGFLDSFLKYNQQELVPTAEQGSFVSFSFLMAGFIGIIWYLAVWLLQKKTPAFKSIWGGIALGIPNYGSIYFLIKSLDMPDLESSLIFPVNNVGIVTLSVICAKFLFTEKLSVANWMGIILALLSITLMSIANFIL